MNLGFIPTLELPERKRGQLVVVAFCPVCDRAEEALDEGQGPEHARKLARAKVTSHFQSRHKD